MPFDGTDFEAGLRQPSLRALSVVLRDPTLWPPGFSWDYCVPGKCALGLARELWGWRNDPTDLIKGEDHAAIFFGLGSKIGVWMWNVQPTHVAAAIDHWLANGGIDRRSIRRDVRPSLWHRLRKFF